MIRNLLMILSIGLFCLLAGCSARMQTATALTEDGSAPEAPLPVPPRNMRLGNAYVSALNEQCYELIPVSMQFESARAMCLRGTEWEVLPPVLTDLPGNNAAR